MGSMNSFGKRNKGHKSPSKNLNVARYPTKEDVNVARNTTKQLRHGPQFSKSMWVGMDTNGPMARSMAKMVESSNLSKSSGSGHEDNIDEDLDLILDLDESD